MPGRDRRTVDELLADSDILARETLLDLSADQGPAMLRTWGQVVQVTAQLWSVLPADPSQRADPYVMPRLHAMGRGVASAISAGGFPGPGPYDERLLEISLNLAQATVAVRREVGGGGELSPPAEAVEAWSARSQLVHILYVTAHATRVTLDAYVAQQDQQLHIDTQRRRLLATRPDPAEVTTARKLAVRLDVFEQVAGESTQSHSGGPSRSEPADGRTPMMQRLESALAVWDIQAHRTAARAPDIPDLVRIARVQALIAAATGVVAQAAAQHRLIDLRAVQRLTPFLHQAEAAWTRSAQRWGDLVSPASRTDPALIRAAAEIRGAVAAAICTRTGWARPDQLAARIDLPQTIQTLQVAAASAVDLAYLGRDVAATNPHLTTAARSRSVPLHESVRRGLVDLADDVIGAAGQAAVAVAPIRSCTPQGRSTSPTVAPKTPEQNPKIGRKPVDLRGPNR